jgi:integrase/recombinase XerD
VVRRFPLHLVESGASFCTANRIMTGVRFLFRITLRRHDPGAEVWHIKELQKLPPVLGRKHCPLRAAAPRAVHSREHLAYCVGLPAVRL